MITLYVLKGITGRRYVGISNDLSRRLKEHKGNKTSAGRLLKKFNVIYTEKFADYKQARKREKFLKSGRGREWLEKLEQRAGSAGGG